MATTRELALSISFADSTKRSLKFANISEDAEGGLKARVKAIIAGTDGTNSITGWKQYLRSSGNATATGITAATYTITSTTPIYDAASYDG